jgi:hypothetical protein
VTKLSKYLDIKHKYLQQQVKAGHVRLAQISTADQNGLSQQPTEVHPLHARIRSTSFHPMTSKGGVDHIQA